MGVPLQGALLGVKVNEGTWGLGFTVIVIDAFCPRHPPKKRLRL
jgi:hypothetical protein